MQLRRLGRTHTHNFFYSPIDLVILGFNGFSRGVFVF